MYARMFVHKREQRQNCL